ncbi:MAG: NAD-glutamate dehydrogenase, partial [Gammaproteobacteria bacterium]
MKNAVTEKLIKAVKAARPAPGREEIDFLRSFYHRLSRQDFSSGKAAAFRAAAMRHRALGATRAPGETLIEAYNLHHARGESMDDRDATILNIICDDKPFIIDSLTIQLNALRKTPHRIAHPIFEVRRDARGQMLRMARYAGNAAARHSGQDGLLETYIQFRIDFTGQGEHAQLLRELHGVMSDVDIVVDDWAKMRANMLSLAGMVESRRREDGARGGLSKLSKGSGGEHGELLRWLENHNFAFLGYAEVEVTDDARGRRATLDRASALGVLRAA